MLNTRSAFTYGHTVTDDNKAINFSEGAGELTANIEVGSYTLDAYVNALSNALNDVGLQEYTVTLTRATRKISITAASVFDLLIASGTQSGADAFNMIGFTAGDLSGLNTYEGDSASGSYFEPQLWLQKYVDFKDNVKTTSANINQSASGSVEIVSYGTVRFMECNIMFQTDLEQGKGSAITTNLNGVEQLRDFLTYGITKSPMEFIPDTLNPSIDITDCLLEKTKESSKGVDFKLKEMYAKSFAFYFESGTLTFRELV
jgi:hypothetical protein